MIKTQLHVILLLLRWKYLKVCSGIDSSKKTHILLNHQIHLISRLTSRNSTPVNKCHLRNFKIKKIHQISGRVLIEIILSKQVFCRFLIPEFNLSTSHYVTGTFGPSWINTATQQRKSSPWTQSLTEFMNGMIRPMKMVSKNIGSTCVTSY